MQKKEIKMTRDEMKNLKELNIENFTLVTNLITKIDSVTYDMIGYEESDYIEITKPANDSSQYVIMFYKDSELTKVLLAVDYDDLLAQINSGIKEVWK